MPDVELTPEQYREIADQMRRIACKLTDPKGATEALTIAEKYDELAKKKQKLTNAQQPH